MAVRGIVIPEHGQRADDLYALGIGRHQDLGLLLIASGLKIRLAHHDCNLAARITEPRGPPFATVDHIFIAIAFDPGFDIGGIGRGNLRFGHQKGRANFAVHQGAQPLLLLLACAVAVEYFHIAGIGRRAVETFGRYADSSHLFGAQRIFEVGQLFAFKFKCIVHMGLARMRRHEKIPQPGRFGLSFQFLKRLAGAPAVLGRKLGRIIIGPGPDFLVDKVLNAVAEMRFARGEGEVHDISPSGSIFQFLLCCGASRIRAIRPR